MIFYFTGTGNSKFVAEKIAKETGEGKVINIADCMKNGDFSFTLSEGEALGFSVPVYFAGIPIIVMDFLKKLQISSPKEFYSFLALNCGGMTANAANVFKRRFKVKSVFSVVAPDNYVPMYKMADAAKVNEQLGYTEKELMPIIEHIKAKNTGSFDSHRKAFSRTLTFLGYGLFKKGIARKTKKFSVNENCTGCGLCEKICPRQVIKLQSGKPNWIKPKCEVCFGCLHRCPAAAINYGKKTAENGRYVNPRTKL